MTRRISEVLKLLYSADNKRTQVHEPVPNEVFLKAEILNNDIYWDFISLLYIQMLVFLDILNSSRQKDFPLKAVPLGRLQKALFWQ
jgi:hypothetical protein